LASPEVVVMGGPRVVIALAWLAAAAGCTGLRVTSDVNPDVSVSVCSTYAWAGEFRTDTGRGPVITNPLIESRLRSAIAANLQANGVQPAAPGTEAACLVGYGIGRRTIVEGGYPYGAGWGWPGPYGWGGPWMWDGPYVHQRGLVAIKPVPEPWPPAALARRRRAGPHGPDRSGCAGEDQRGGDGAVLEVSALTGVSVPPAGAARAGHAGDDSVW
jgi:hypothetical protein